MLNNRRVFTWILVILSAPLCLAQDGVMPAAVEREVDFAEEVHPILAGRCYECHGGNQRKGGLKLDSREGILEGGELGPVVNVGDSADSYLIKVVSGLDPELKMPEDGPPLSADEIGILRAWIDQGVQWDYGVEGEPEYVAPVRLREVTLPDEDGNPIDRLLQPYLEEHGIDSPELISGRVFARRVYFDVIGLPPTPEELKAFVDSKRGTKRARLVRRLLDDRRGYSEHWMTFWNDALRNNFVGTGYIDGGRKQITSWLYDALYFNLPYDQFTTQLINPTGPAEGFVKGIVWRGTTAANDQPAMQAARSVAQVFLGINLKCASCHDSFVDQWKLKDAYGLASVFAKEPLELVRCDAPLGEYAESKFLWPELGEIDDERSVEGRRAQLARVLTSEANGNFTRTIVNRLWKEVFGRGMVEPLHAIENEPWHPELLDWLARDLIDHGYDLKHTLEVMLTSEVYQWPSTPTQPDGEYVFRGPQLKRLNAEQFADAISMMTGVWQDEPRFTLPYMDKDEPRRVRAWRVVSDELTRALGRPNREQIVLARAGEATTLQALELTNGDVLYETLRKGAEKLLEQEWASREALIEAVYWRGLQRAPSENEMAVALDLAGESMTADGVADLLWAVVMLPEFQLVY